MTRTLLSFAIVLLATLPSARAGTITVLGADNPSGIIEQHLAANRTARAERNKAGTGMNERSFGQTFFASGDMRWDGLALKSAGGRNFTNLSATQLQIKVFDMDAANASSDDGQPDGDNVLLDTFSFDVRNLSYSGDTWLGFDFDNSLNLDAGGLYGFLVFWEGGNDGNDNLFDVRHSGQNPTNVATDFGDVLPGGAYRTNVSNYNDVRWDDNNVPWFGVGTTSPVAADLTFVVFGVPEPSTYALGLLGALGVVVCVRRRFRKL